MPLVTMWLLLELARLFSAIGRAFVWCSSETLRIAFWIDGTPYDLSRKPEEDDDYPDDPLGT